jgi:ubiquinone/menaquinone biosynthesis C-methylase UbiE
MKRWNYRCRQAALWPLRAPTIPFGMVALGSRPYVAACAHRPTAKHVPRRLEQFPIVSADAAKRAAIEQWTADPCGAETVDEEPGSRLYFERLLAARAQYAPWMEQSLGYAETDGMVVLDVGCGQGIDLARYAMAGARVIGLDLTPRHVELARAHLRALGLEAEIVEGDAERMPFPDSIFDRASSNGVLHHTPDLPAALRELWRVVRPGGEVRIVVYNRRSLHYWLTQVTYVGLWKRRLFREGSMAAVLSSNVERSSTGGRPLVRVYEPPQVRRLLEAAGFEQVETTVRHFRPSDEWPWGYLGPFVRPLRDPKVLDRIGRIAGWYVIGRGRRPG